MVCTVSRKQGEDAAWLMLDGVVVGWGSQKQGKRTQGAFKGQFRVCRGAQPCVWSVEGGGVHTFKAGSPCELQPIPSLQLFSAQGHRILLQFLSKPGVAQVDGICLPCVRTEFHLQHCPLPKTRSPDPGLAWNLLVDSPCALHPLKQPPVQPHCLSRVRSLHS